MDQVQADDLARAARANGVARWRSNHVNVASRAIPAAINSEPTGRTPGTNPGLDHPGNDCELKIDGVSAQVVPAPEAAGTNPGLNPGSIAGLILAKLSSEGSPQQVAHMHARMLQRHVSKSLEGMPPPSRTRTVSELQADYGEMCAERGLSDLPWRAVVPFFAMYTRRRYQWWRDRTGKKRRRRVYEIS